MFEAKLSQAGIFKKVLDAVRDLVPSANFDCTGTGFGLHAIDTSHVALVSLLLNQEAFEEFRCDKNISLGMSIASLVKVFRCCDSDDILSIRAKESEDKAMFEIEAPDGHKSSKFELSLMMIEAEKLTIPKSTYPVTVSMSSASFAKIVRDLSSIGDSIVIAVTKSGISFKTEGSIGTAEIACTPRSSDDMETEDLSIEITEPASSQFAARYLNSFCKATPLAEKVVLRMSNDRPMSVEYNIENIGHITYYLAPKIEDTDMEEE